MDLKEIHQPNSKRKKLIEMPILFLFLFVLTLPRVECRFQNRQMQQREGSEYSNFEVLDNGRYVIQWSVDREQKQIEFEVTVMTRGYVGFGLSSKGRMLGADIVLGGVYSNGTTYFTDRHGRGNQEPVIDKSQDWQLHEAEENSTHTTLRFSRALDTCDRDDYQILEQDTVVIIWSYGRSDNPSQYHVGSRGQLAVNLLDPNVIPRDIKQASFNPEPPSRVLLSKNKLKLWTITSRTRISKRATSRHCTVHQAPRLKRKHHIVGFRTRLETQQALQHTQNINLFRCTAPPMSDPEQVWSPFVNGTGSDCTFMNRPTGEIPTQYCTEITYVYGAGGRIMFYPDHVGQAMGELPEEFYLLQVHYDNPDRRNDIKLDVSIDVYYTDQLRPSELGILSIGHQTPGSPSLLIPPASPNHQIYGHCGSDCTERMLPREGINIFQVAFRANRAARSLRLRQFRHQEELPWIMEDNNYDVSYQGYRVLNQEVNIRRGDHLLLRCSYDSTNSNGTVTGGISFRHEMCLAYIYFYNRLPEEYAQCRSEITDDYYQRRYLGISNSTWSDDRNDVVALLPPRLANKTLVRVSNTEVRWTKELKKEIQEDHKNLPQVSVCPRSDAISIAAQGQEGTEEENTFPVKYPTDAKKYTPPQRLCSKNRKKEMEMGVVRNQFVIGETEEEENNENETEEEAAEKARRNQKNQNQKKAKKNRNKQNGGGGMVLEEYSSNLDDSTTSGPPTLNQVYTLRQPTTVDPLDMSEEREGGSNNRRPTGPRRIPGTGPDRNQGQGNTLNQVNSLRQPSTGNPPDISEERGNVMSVMGLPPVMMDEMLIPNTEEPPIYSNYRTSTSTTSTSSSSTTRTNSNRNRDRSRDVATNQPMNYDYDQGYPMEGLIIREEPRRPTGRGKDRMNVPQMKTIDINPNAGGKQLPSLNGNGLTLNPNNANNEQRQSRKGNKNRLNANENNDQGTTGRGNNSNRLVLNPTAPQIEVVNNNNNDNKAPRQRPSKKVNKDRNAPPKKVIMNTDELYNGINPIIDMGPITENMNAFNGLTGMNVMNAGPAPGARSTYNRFDGAQMFMPNDVMMPPMPPSVGRNTFTRVGGPRPRPRNQNSEIPTGPSKSKSNSNRGSGPSSTTPPPAGATLTSSEEQFRSRPRPQIVNGYVPPPPQPERARNELNKLSRPSPFYSDDVNIPPNSTLQTIAGQKTPTRLTRPSPILSDPAPPPAQSQGGNKNKTPSNRPNSPNVNNALPVPTPPTSTESQGERTTSNRLIRPNPFENNALPTPPTSTESQAGRAPPPDRLNPILDAVPPPSIFTQTGRAPASQRVNPPNSFDNIPPISLKAGPTGTGRAPASQRLNPTSSFDNMPPIPLKAGPTGTGRAPASQRLNPPNTFDNMPPISLKAGPTGTGRAPASQRLNPPNPFETMPPISLKAGPTGTGRAPASQRLNPPNPFDNMPPIPLKAGPAGPNPQNQNRLTRPNIFSMNDNIIPTTTTSTSMGNSFFRESVSQPQPQPQPYNPFNMIPTEAPRVVNTFPRGNSEEVGVGLPELNRLNNSRRNRTQAIVYKDSSEEAGAGGNRPGGRKTPKPVKSTSTSKAPGAYNVGTGTGNRQDRNQGPPMNTLNEVLTLRQPSTPNPLDSTENNLGVTQARPLGPTSAEVAGVRETTPIADSNRNRSSSTSSPSSGSPGPRYVAKSTSPTTPPPPVITPDPNVYGRGVGNDDRIRITMNVVFDNHDGTLTPGGTKELSINNINLNQDQKQNENRGKTNPNIPTVEPEREQQEQEPGQQGKAKIQPGGVFSFTIVGNKVKVGKTRSRKPNKYPVVDLSEITRQVTPSSQGSDGDAQVNNLNQDNIERLRPFGGGAQGIEQPATQNNEDLNVNTVTPAPYTPITPGEGVVTVSTIGNLKSGKNRNKGKGIGVKVANHVTFQGVTPSPYIPGGGVVTVSTSGNVNGAVGDDGHDHTGSIGLNVANHVSFERDYGRVPSIIVNPPSIPGGVSGAQLSDNGQYLVPVPQYPNYIGTNLGHSVHIVGGNGAKHTTHSHTSQLINYGEDLTSHLTNFGWDHQTGNLAEENAKLANQGFIVGGSTGPSGGAIVDNDNGGRSHVIIENNLDPYNDPQNVHSYVVNSGSGQSDGSHPRPPTAIGEGGGEVDSINYGWAEGDGKDLRPPTVTGSRDVDDSLNYGWAEGDGKVSRPPTVIGSRDVDDSINYGWAEGDGKDEHEVYEEVKEVTNSNDNDNNKGSENANQNQDEYSDPDSGKGQDHDHDDGEGDGEHGWGWKSE